MGDEAEAPAPAAAPAAAASGAKASRPRRRRKSGRSGEGGGSGGGRTPQCWMVVSSPDNMRKTRDQGFSIQGLKSRHKRRVESMRPGDRLLYYVTGRAAFAATVTITSPMYEDHTPIWRASRREEDYPWRVHIRPDTVLDEPDWVPAKELAYRLDYVRKWPPEHWNLAFQGHIHALPRNDFTLIEDEIARTARKRQAVAAEP